MKLILMIEEYELNEENIYQQATDILNEIRDKFEADYDEISGYEIIIDD